MRKDLAVGCAGVVLIAIVMIFGGAISFGLGWLGGLFLKWICGAPVADYKPANKQINRRALKALR